MSLDEPMAQLVRGIAPLAAFALGLALERRVPHASLRPEWRANLGLWLIDSVLTAVVCGACGFAVAVWARDTEVGLINAVKAPLGVGIAVTVIGLDLVSYVWHRANHEVSFVWRFHRVHHADADYHVSTALRFHPGEILMALPVRLAALVFIGAPPVAVVVFEAVFGIANVLEHGNFNLAPRLERALGRVFVTPALHRRHHSTERRERDTNFGTIFSVWDRLAGTYRPNTSASHFATGLRFATGAVPRSIAAMLLAPFRAGARDA